MDFNFQEGTEKRRNSWFKVPKFARAPSFSLPSGLSGGGMGITPASSMSAGVASAATSKPPKTEMTTR